MVVPCGRRSIAMTLSCFEFAWAFRDVAWPVCSFGFRAADLRDRCVGFFPLLGGLLLWSGLGPMAFKPSSVI